MLRCRNLSQLLFVNLIQVSCTINTCSGGECNTDSSPCDTVTPVVTSLSFSEHLDYLTFQFAKPVGFSDFDYDCFALFDKGGDLLGDYPFCYFLNDPSKRNSFQLAFVLIEQSLHSPWC